MRLVLRSEVAGTGRRWHGTTIRIYTVKSWHCLFQLEINYEDGSHETILTDGSWKTSDAGPVRNSEIYDGETYDARMEKPGWNAPGYDDKSWSPVSEKDFPKNILIATYNEPVKKHENFKAIKSIKTPKGEQVIDFGQNLVGWETIDG